MQGAQTNSRFRGIGRYTLSLVKAIIKNNSEHEIIIALSGLFPDTIESIRSEFYGLIPQEQIQIWEAPEAVCYMDSSNEIRRSISESIQLGFFQSLNPDIIHITSLFEGFEDDAITSVCSTNNSFATLVTVYDLIPFVYRKHYLDDNQLYKKYYLEKIEHLKRSTGWLGISQATCIEAVNLLKLPQEKTFNISAAIDPVFCQLTLSANEEKNIIQKFKINKPFLMYVGGDDARKNLIRLIRAYATIDLKIRSSFQLLLCGKFSKNFVESLKQISQEHRIREEEIIFSGYITDQDLISLYNICYLFVFPSWHEGFGLPVLEAMACGAAVIASNTSSIPEVIENEDALFDPYDEASIAKKIKHVLTDNDFRLKLIENGLKQSKKFSWDKCAIKCIEAYEKIFSLHKQELKKIVNNSKILHKPKVAYLSPLRPEKSGISDYSAELLPVLAEYYDIDIIVPETNISDNWIKNHLEIHDIMWFKKNSHNYQRVIYHFGNSTAHEHMFDLLKIIPGIVVLHDFFLGHIYAHMEGSNANKYNFWKNELYHSHGYNSLIDLAKCNNIWDIAWKYPVNLTVIQNSIGIIAHSEYPKNLALNWYGNSVTEKWITIPLLRAHPQVFENNKNKIRNLLGLEKEDFLICSFGLLGEGKQNILLLQAWLNSKLSQSKNSKLIFIGGQQNNEYCYNLFNMIKNSGMKKSIRFTNEVDTSTYHQYLFIADMAVQLRKLSRGETSAAVLDCLNYGIPTIVNANGSMAEFNHGEVYLLPEEIDEHGLANAMDELWSNNQLQKKLSLNALSQIKKFHQPEICAQKYYKVIETFYEKYNTTYDNTINKITQSKNSIITDSEILGFAKAMAHNFPPSGRKNQIYIDVSELVHQDIRTGIQRVTRSILKELLLNPPAGYRIEPVYATSNQFGYRYARKFTLNFLGCPALNLEDDLIDATTGDLFIGLDLQPQVVSFQESYLKKIYLNGVKVYFVIYDLLPVSNPNVFPPGADIGHRKWLETISKFSGAVCISKAVADEMRMWIKHNNPEKLMPFDIGWFHLGADLENSVPSRGLPDNIEPLIRAMKSRPTFLMVGTIEPRKGHLQTLSAFEILWLNGYDINLIIVGKEGWKGLPENMRRTIPTIIEKLNLHSEKEKKLFWLDGISDEFLEIIYKNSTCLISASEGEGFGLPLIEAAQHSIPIIARDIPVFREVAGENAHYFRGDSPENLADSVKEWLNIYESKQFPKSQNIPWITWGESREQFIDFLLKK